MKAVPIIAALVLSICSLASAAEPELVKVELFTDAAELRPGQTFTAFVRLTIAEGWHIYWKNPGDSGQATRVNWVLPEGFAASELLYPVPSVFRDTATINFGYSGTVVFVARITPGPDAGKLKDLSLGANVSWLRCSADVCVPGRASLQASLPAPADQQKTGGELAKAWLPRIPNEAAPGDLIITGALAPDTAGNSSGQFEIRVRGLKDVNSLKDLAFFPGLMPALSIDKTRIGREDGQVVVTFSAHVLKGLKLPSTTLDSVLAYSDPTGERRGVNVAIPLLPAR